MATPKTYVSREFGQVGRYLWSANRRRAVILTSPSRRFVEPLVAALAPMAVRVFDGAKVHVPVEVLDAADAELGDADALVAIGGGAAIGLGKALRVRHPDLAFVAIPTTFSGSEMTTMYGSTSGTTKQTGRLPAAQPDAVFYFTDLVRELPVPLAIQSLQNGIAHVISVLSTGSLDATARGDAEAAAATVVRAIELLLAEPSDAARELAQRGASACGAAFELGKPGVQHGLAHLLGGALRVEHAALHAILLPHFVAHLRATQPALVTALERVLEPQIRDIYTSEVREGDRDLAGYLHDVLTRAGAPVALTALGPTVTRDAIDAALATRPELPRGIVDDALHGLRPAPRIDLGSEPHAVVLGDPAGARAIILALHGRGAEAGTIARRYRDIVGDPAVAVVGLRAPLGAPRWYEIKYGAPGAGEDAEALAAIARVETALATLHALGKPIFLAGFSQGACLALEVAARTQVPLAGVLAPAGARLGQPPWPSRDGLAMPVVVGAARDDKWIAQADLDATIAWFRAAGSEVDDLRGEGDKHEITAAQRARIRAVVG